ncbi:uncharacterized protein C4orf19 homolog [Podarcis raffonei]|uniref:uncharacterized protein C4orf19 homolog n=1 Tax=Podarcis raffonei TaxID=65483 RepID=UPI00232975BC|nr:uncharacterized protein C4orf19 homolog [Podarcis raffonei]
MGCRCCKMIQSYIFEPQDVPTSGYINEINNFKSDEQDGGKFKCKQNNDIQVHKNELQTGELQTAANRHKLNNNKEAVLNHRGGALRDEGLGNLAEKCHFNVNGIHSHSGANLHPNPSTNRNREISTHTCSAQRAGFSVQGLPQPSTRNNHEILETEVLAKASSEKRSALYEESQRAPGNDTHLPGPTDPPNGGYAGKQRAAGNESPSNNHIHTGQNTEHTMLSSQQNLPLGESKSWDSTDKACRTGQPKVCFKDNVTDSIPSPRTKSDAVREARFDCHNDINGELEEEVDAEVAEALAALEAATAGEDFEEEEDY